MSQDEAGGPSAGQPEREARRRTPPPGSRTPPPRTRSTDRGEVEHRPVKRERPKGSLFGRVLGRQGLDEALQQRFEPYDYEPTRPVLKWLFLGLIAFVIAGAFAVFSDFELRSQVDEWRSEDGLTEIPISPDEVFQGSVIADNELRDPDVLICNEAELESSSLVGQGCRSIDNVFKYAVSEGFDCTNLEDLASIVPGADASGSGCDRIEEVSSRYDDLVNRSGLMKIVVIVLLLIVAFPFSSFVHRSSRNLRTLKSEGQKHSPDGAVLRFFVPLINIYKPLFVFIELFKASDPNVREGDTEAWRKSGAISPFAVLWAVAWGAFVVFNPITVRFFYRGRDGLDDVSSATSGSIIVDVLVIALGVLAMAMAYTLSRRQEARALKHGTVTVTPVRPRDPLEKALEEDDRIRDRSTGKRDERKSKGRKN